MDRVRKSERDEPPSERTARPTRSILVVEDSRTQAEHIRHLLHRGGYEVATGENGAQGLALIRSSPPDLIISDVLMPDMDGYSLCRAVKTSPETRHIPFVLLTDLRGPADIINGLQHGADNFITKPFEDEYLLERVRRIFEHLERRQSGRFEVDVTIRFGGREVVLNADKQQMIELLFATSEELARAIDELRRSKRTVEEHARTLEDRVRERTLQLAQAEAKYRALVEQIPAVTYAEALEEAGRLFYISPQAEYMFGLPALQLLAETDQVYAHVHPEDRTRVRRTKEECRRTGEPFGCEYRVLAADGRDVWVRDEAVVVKDEEGRPRYLQGVLLDVTEQKHSERAIRESEHRYRLLFENSPLPTWIFDLESLRFLAVNDAAVRHYGYTREEFLRMTIADIRPREDVPTLLANIEARPPRAQDVGVWRHRKKDGALIDVEVTANDFVFEGWRARLIVAHDVTAQREARRALVAHARQQAAVAAMSQRCLAEGALAGLMDELVRVVAETLGIEYCGILELMPETGNLLLRAGFGWREGSVGAATVPAGEGSLTGRALFCEEPLIVQDLRTETRFPLSPLARDHDVVSGMTVLIQAHGRPFGMLGAYSNRSRRFSDDDVHFLEAVANVFASVVERERAAEELARQRAAFAQTEKLAAMGTLLAGVAHELNNPLSIVLGQSGLLRRAAGEGPLAERADKIAQAAERCARIVANFLALARQRPPERHRTNVNQVVQEAIELLAYPLRVDGVEVALDLAPDLPVIWADRHQLNQVVLNLVTNAHQAMRGSPGPRRVTLSTGLDRGSSTVAVVVADSGPGIPPEVQSRLFEPFFTTKAPGQGTGLGLSLCRGIAEAHGGHVEVESTPGQGALFRLKLPVRVPAASAPVPASAAEESLGSRHVLVVDDEAALAEVLAEILTIDGHRVDVVMGGAAALARVRERRYDMMLTDIKMPGMDGPSLYREIQPVQPELARRTVFLTGDSLSPETADFLRSSGAPSIDKPFTIEDVRRVIRRVLAGVQEVP